MYTVVFVFFIVVMIFTENDREAILRHQGREDPCPGAYHIFSRGFSAFVWTIAAFVSRFGNEQVETLREEVMSLVHSDLFEVPDDE